MLVEGMWSEWSKAVTYSTKFSSHEVMHSPQDSNPDVFPLEPIVSEPPKPMDIDGANVANKSWNGVLDSRYQNLNSMNLALMLRLSRSLKEYGKQPPAKSLNGGKPGEVINDNEISILARETDMEMSADSLRRNADSEGNPFHRSSSCPVPRARTKADLRLGGLRLVSSPKRLNLHTQSTQASREAKRPRLSADTPKMNGENTSGQPLAASASGIDFRKVNVEVEAKKRKLLTLELAARLQRLQGQQREEWLDVDHEAMRHSPSPSSPSHTQADTQLQRAAESGGNGGRRQEVDIVGPITSFAKSRSLEGYEMPISCNYM
jgi:hypothetical protein